MLSQKAKLPILLPVYFGHEFNPDLTMNRLNIGVLSIKPCCNAWLFKYLKVSLGLLMAYLDDSDILTKN